MPVNVVVIDDEQVIREGCTRVLTKEGYQVVTADNGASGLELMNDEPADVVLLDLMMPGMDGFEVLSNIKEKWPETYVIIITGFATVEKAVQAMKNGAFDFLAKPFNPDYLRIVVKRALDKKNLVAEAKALRDEHEKGLAAVMTEQSRLRTIINHMESGVLVVDKDLTVLLHNPNLIRMLEIQTDPMVGKPLSDGITNKKLCEIVSKVCETEKTISQEFEEGSIGKAFLRAHCAPIKRRDGEIMGSVTVFEDLSALKKVDQQKNEFVAMVSHELRAPLASVEQMCYVLRDGLAGDINDKGKHLIGRILVRTKELLQLVKNLLDLSRIETGILVQNMDSINLHEFVKGVVDMVSPQVDVKKQTITLNASDHDVTILGDRDNLLGVFNNIIGNAVKYTPDNGAIDISIEKKGSLVQISVKDTGVGIPREELSRIFDKFFRVKGKTRGITGSGLGLSVAKSIVEAHRGSIEVESAEEKGSVFTIILPVQDSVQN